MSMRTRRRRRFRIGVAAAACVVLLSLSVASASTLGGLHTTSLFAQSRAAPAVVPRMLVADSFTSGTFTTGRVPQSRQYLSNTWTVVAGTWSILNGQVDPPNGNNRIVVYDAGTANGVVSATLFKRGRFQIGLMARSNAAATTYLVAELDDINLGTATLRKVVNGASTTLATAGGVGQLDVVPLRVELSGSSVTVRYNGTAVITHTLSAADQTTFGSLTVYGLWASTSNNDRFDDFYVATWPPN